MENLAPITVDADLPTKKYVDDKVAAGGGGSEVELSTVQPAGSTWEIWIDTDAVGAPMPFTVNDADTRYVRSGNAPDPPRLTVGLNPPSSPAPGDLWVDTN